MKNYIVVIWQIVTYFIIGLPLRLFYRVNRTYDFRYEKGMKYIIAANHPKRIDPFIISYSFPFTDFIKLLPLRFITAEQYMRKIYLVPGLLLYGCITTKKTRQGTTLERASKLMEEGETIFIFPTGKLETKETTTKIKTGVSYLGTHVRNAKIIPVYISYNKDKTTDVIFKNIHTIENTRKASQEHANNVYHTIISK